MKNQIENNIKDIEPLDSLCNRLCSDGQFFYRNIKIIANLLVVLCLILLFYDNYSKLRYHILVDENNNKYIIDILTFQKWKKINYVR